MAANKSAAYSRNKGARGEVLIRDQLRKATGLGWERTPGSGALNEKHALKGDLYIPNEKNFFCVEVKNYKDDHISSKLLTSKKPQISEWWDQCIRQSAKVDKLPMLFFKFDRSKTFVAFTEESISFNFAGGLKPSGTYIYYSEEDIYIMQAEEFLDKNKVRWILTL